MLVLLLSMPNITVAKSTGLPPYINTRPVINDAAYLDQLVYLSFAILLAVSRYCKQVCWSIYPAA